MCFAFRKVLECQNDPAQEVALYTRCEGAGVNPKGGAYIPFPAICWVWATLQADDDFCGLTLTLGRVD